MRKLILAFALVAAPVLAVSTTTASACWDDDYVSTGYRSYGYYSDGPRYRSYRSYRRAGWYDPTVSVYVGPRYRSYRSDWWW